VSLLRVILAIALVFFAPAFLLHPRGGAPNPVIGMISDGPCGSFTAYEAWLGQPSGAVQRQIYGFAGATTVSGIESAITGAQCGSSARPMSISYGISDTAANVLAGNYDTTLANIGTAMQATVPHAVFRWDWEFNGNWYVWGISPGGAGTYTAAQYISVWQHAITAIRNAANAAGPNHIRFEWNADLCPGCVDMATAWPGTAYVDIIGLDGYDSAANVWSTGWLSCSPNCLAEQVSLAQTYSKDMALGEWGVGYDEGGSFIDAHSVTTIQNMAAWMQAHGNGYRTFVYFNYWNTDEPNYCGVIDGFGSLGNGTCPPPGVTNYGPTAAGPPYQNPLSAAAFLGAFGR
jgi:glycosyl hydrolase family 26